MAAGMTADLRIAVLLTFEAQLLDMAGIDLFGMLDREYAQYLPGPLSKLGIDVKIHYVGKESKDSKGSNNLQNLTGQAAVRAEATLEDEAVQPGNLEIVMIPGPPPGQQQSEKTLSFVRKHAEHGTTILVICTGCYVGAQAGIYDGRVASGPRGLGPALRKEYPQITWDEDRRWIKDVKVIKDKTTSELWSSGGVTNGLEMIAAYIREKYPGPYGEAVIAMADVGEKGERYDTTVAVDTAWWLGQIFRAFFTGQRPKRSIK